MYISAFNAKFSFSQNRTQSVPYQHNFTSQDFDSRKDLENEKIPKIQIQNDRIFETFDYPPPPICQNKIEKENIIKYIANHNVPSLMNNSCDINNNTNYTKNQTQPNENVYNSENNFQNKISISNNQVADADIRVIVNRAELDIKYPINIKNDQLRSDFGKQFIHIDYTISHRHNSCFYF